MESESEPRPCHNQLAVYPLEGTPKVRLQKRQNHTVRDLVADHAPHWDTDQPIGIWEIRDVRPYPVVARYCHCIALYGPPYPVDAPGGVKWNRPGTRWVGFEPDGGVYDPQWAADALIARIRAKTSKYSAMHRTQNLVHFALLVHYGVRGMMHNTPYKGRNARLEDAAMRSHECLLADHVEFDSAYLYMNLNGGKLVKLFPEFATIKEFSHQPGKH